jgi:hypothetical protein
VYDDRVVRVKIVQSQRNVVSVAECFAETETPLLIKQCLRNTAVSDMDMQYTEDGFLTSY